MSFPKSLFKSTPIKRTWDRCVRADQALLMRAIRFYEGFNAAGVEMQPDESALPELDKIAATVEAGEDTLYGISVWLGCIAAEEQRGKWVRSGRSRGNLGDHAPDS